MYAQCGGSGGAGRSKTNVTVSPTVRQKTVSSTVAVALASAAAVESTLRRIVALGDGERCLGRAADTIDDYAKANAALKREPHPTQVVFST